MQKHEAYIYIAILLYTIKHRGRIEKSSFEIDRQESMNGCLQLYSGETKYNHWDNDV